MSDKLNMLVDNYVELQNQKVFPSGIEDDYKSVYIDAAKQQLYDMIYEEVKEEVQDQAVIDAEDILEKKAGLRRIEELRKLVFEGFFAAIFVGLLVNQLTDLIGCLKGSMSLSFVWPTALTVVLLLIICIAVYFWLFASELTQLVKKEYRHEADSNKPKI